MPDFFSFPMFRLVVNSIVIVFGITFLLDGFLPTKFESVQVSQHVDSYSLFSRNKVYKIEFSNSRVGNCSIPYATYNRVKDGESLDIQESLLLKECIQIKSGDKIIRSEIDRKLVHLIGGLLAIAFGFGILKTGHPLVPTKN